MALTVLYTVLSSSKFKSNPMNVISSSYLRLEHIRHISGSKTLTSLTHVLTCRISKLFSTQNTLYVDRVSLLA